MQASPASITPNRDETAAQLQPRVPWISRNPLRGSREHPKPSHPLDTSPLFQAETAEAA